MATDKPYDPQTAVTPAGTAPGLSAAEAPNAASVEEPQKLDPRVVRIWSIAALIRNGILLVAGLVGGTLLHLYASLSLLIVIPIWLLLLLLLVLEAGYLPRRRYEATSYRIGNDVFEFCTGLVWTASVMIPISRIQHIDLLRGPLERHHGLASLNIHTAGTSNASQKVSGLEAGTAIAVRERIMGQANLEWEPLPEINPDA